MVGGEAGEAVYGWDELTHRWTNPGQLPDFPGGYRDFEVCGVATRSDGLKEVVVTGGSINGTAYQETHIFSPQTGQWRPGADFPVPIEGAEAVQFGHTFIVVGGFVDQREGSYDNIWMWEPDTLTWTDTGKKLALGRAPRGGAFFVPDDHVTCN